MVKGTERGLGAVAGGNHAKYIGSDTAVHFHLFKRFYFTLPLGTTKRWAAMPSSAFCCTALPALGNRQSLQRTAGSLRLPSAALQVLLLHRSGRLHPQGAALLCG